MVHMITFWEISFISFWSVVLSGTVSWESDAILPSSVFIPVANTTPYQLPVATVVHMNTRLCLSPTSASHWIAWVYLFTGFDSPVKEKSLVCRFISSITLKSAGIPSPSSINTISPGTSSEAFTSTNFPSLFTLATGFNIFLSDCIIFSAFASWKYPIHAFTNKSMAIMPAPL